MARIFSLHSLSTHFTLRILHILLALAVNLEIVKADSTIGYFWETNQHTYDAYFCKTNNTEVKNECSGPPGTCLYPIQFLEYMNWESIQCQTFVECVMNKEPRSPDLDPRSKKMAKAHLRNCSAHEEFSNVTRKCEPSGAPGSCTEQSLRQFAERDVEPGARVDPASYTAFQYCNGRKNPEVLEGCKVGGGCKYSLPGHCDLYIECIGPYSRAQYRFCPQSMEFSSVTRKCEPLGSPGTCSAEKEKEGLVRKVRSGILHA